MGEDFRDLLKDTDDTVLSQNVMVEGTSNLMSILTSRKRSSNAKDNSEVKKRRLTYMSCDNITMDQPRNANNNNNQLYENFDIYEQPAPLNNSSTFNENFHVSEKSPQDSTIADVDPSINNTFQPMEIDFEPDTPNVPALQNTMENVVLDNATLNDVQMDEPINLESELLLEEIIPVEQKKRVRKLKSLVVDKQKTIPKDTIKKNNALYKDKMTEVSPFDQFYQNTHYFKSCADVLFRSGSNRLKKSKLHYLYTRNMKKIPEVTIDDLETSPIVNNVRKSGRNRKTVIELDVIKEQMEVDEENICPDIPVETQKAKNSNQSRARKILGELNTVQNFMLEDDEMLLLPLENDSAHKQREEFMEIDLPPVIETENMKMSANLSYKQDDGVKLSR